VTEGAVDEAAAVIERVRRRRSVSTAERFDEEPDGDVAHLRVPPHSREAEQSVLGGLLLERDAFGRISDILSVADFYRHEHRLIFGAIEALIAAGQPVDVITVFEQLEGETFDFGGLSYLNALAQSVPSAANIRRYAEIIVERATLRQMIAASDEIATHAFNPQGRTVAELIDQAGTALRAIGDARKLKSKRMPLVDLPDLIARAETRRQLVKGVIPAESIGVMFGGSGSFKSFIALDAGLHVAHGLPWLGRRTAQGSVIYLAAEGGDELGQRADAWHRARRLKPDAPFHVAPVAMDLLRDAWRVVEAAQAKGVTPALVVVDTLSQTFGGEENSAPEIAAYMRELGARFRDLWHCAVVVIHHSGHTATERPRGSSAIQANTDYLYGVFREEKELMATLACTHRKGGAPFDDVLFSLSKRVLGTDPDGDEISSLVARHLSTAEEVQEAAEAEIKAGRSTANRLFLQLAQNGAKEEDVRRAFYADCGVEDADARRQAYWRARKSAMTKGFIDIAQGVVITLKRSI